MKTDVLHLAIALLVLAVLAANLHECRAIGAQVHERVYRY